MADQAGRALVGALQKVGARCAVHLVAAHTLGDAAGMECEARGVQAADYSNCSDKKMD